MMFERCYAHDCDNTPVASRFDTGLAVINAIEVAYTSQEILWAMLSRKMSSRKIQWVCIATQKYSFNSNWLSFG